MTLVIASSPMGLRAAAFLAAFGEPVRVLLSASGVGLRGGLPARARTPMAHFWPDARRTTMRDELWTPSGPTPLPVTRRSLARALDGGPIDVALELLWARAESVLSGRKDGYLTWCEQRFGASIARRLCATYLRRRFCMVDAPSWLAWWVHGRGAPTTWWIPNGDPLAFQRDRVLDAGGDVVPDVEILQFDVADGRVVAVETDLGREHVDGRLWVEADPRTLADWCPDLPCVDVPGIRVFEVDIPVEGRKLHAHVVDPARPVWLVMSDERETRAFTSLPWTQRVDRRALADHVATRLGLPPGGAVARPVADERVAEPSLLAPLLERSAAMGVTALVPHRPLALDEEEAWFLGLYRGDLGIPSIDAGTLRHPWGWVST